MTNYPITNAPTATAEATEATNTAHDDGLSSGYYDYVLMHRLTAAATKLSQNKKLIHDLLCDPYLSLPQKNRQDLNSVLQVISDQNQAFGHAQENAQGDAEHPQPAQTLSSQAQQNRSLRELYQRTNRHIELSRNALSNVNQLIPSHQLPVNIRWRMNRALGR